MFKKIIISLLVFLAIILGVYYFTSPEKEETGKETVQVYFSNFEISEECNKVFSVSREVSEKTPEKALEELFKGPTQQEKDLGYSSWFSVETEGVLNWVKIKDNIARIDIDDIRPIISGANSSCGSAQFFSSIEATLEQFEGGENVIISMEGDATTFYEWMQIGCVEENDYCGGGGGGESVANDFFKKGNLVINNPGLEEDTWYLIYDEPGAPGATAKLFFKDFSVCGGVLCREILVEEMKGSRVEIEGENTDGQVKVSKLIFSDVEEKARFIAGSWVVKNSPTFLFDGMSLRFLEARGLDLVGCENCHEVDFGFESRHSGYGNREGEMLAQVITSHVLTLLIDGSSVKKAITDGVFNEIEGEFIEE